MEITLQDLAVFVGWLRNPYNSHKITPFKEVKAKRTERTINLTITVVTAFYDYLYRNQELEAGVRDKLMKEVFMGGRKLYKSFLHHVNEGKPVNKNILKLTEPLRKMKILEKEYVEVLYTSTNNVRDRGELSNGAKLKTGEREIHVSQELMDLYDNYLYEIIDEMEINTNFLFVSHLILP